MSETIFVDRKGRLVLPKKVREQARIGVNTRLVAKVSDVGRIELFDPDILLSKAQEIRAKKLAGWREEDHQATGFLLGFVKDRRK